MDDIISVVNRRCRQLAPDTSLKVDLEADLPLLYVHPALIEQALFNVVENALRFAPAESSITLRAGRDDDQLHIDVHNIGPVIPEDLRESIFDMFFTLSQGDKNQGGTGLGLAICRGIMGAHGGTAHVVQSDAETGTIIRLTLPLTDSQPGPGSEDDDTHTHH